ncbi:hypothetical protein [Sphingomonas sp. 3-13AW]|jgi:hypothetical protein|uniref:hypothetical protein n=1 Tax=Sphingomonas sp. 3-13AW TaxID=3050450 RepID=UPI003BB5D20B
MTARIWAAAVVAGLLIAAGLCIPMARSLDRLADARATRDRLATALQAPAPSPVVAPELALAAPDRAAATRRLAGQLRAAATAGGLLIETIAPADSTAPGLVALDLRVSGPEKAVLAFADRTERARPLARFARWRVEAGEGGSVRLDARLVTPWRS